MFHKPVSGLAGIAVLLFCAAAAPAQDFRVYTQIRDARAPEAAGKKGAPARLLGRSTSLFHAGKVYDYLDAGHQMTIFEPAHERFVIIDGSSRRMTAVSFEFIENHLFRAGKATEEKIAELRAEGTPQAVRQADLLQFQLAPKFVEKYDAQKRLLTLSSPFLSYEVKCGEHDSVALIQGYLNYTDWAQRLNYLVNPRAMPPAPRLALNEVLRRRKLLPVKVTLHTSNREGLHLRAEHRYDWMLDATDRKTITYWERLLNAGDMKEISPEQFFEADAGGKTADRK
ncbi:MAG: hypothetical protein ACM3U2_06210 [Deltaproteobacteria bacterium]